MWIVESTCILNRVDKFIIFWFYTGLFAFPVENNFSEINKLSSMRKLPFQSTHFEKYISVTWQYFAFLSSLFIFSKWPIILYCLKFPKVYVYSKKEFTNQEDLKQDPCLTVCLQILDPHALLLKDIFELLSQKKKCNFRLWGQNSVVGFLQYSS